MQMNPQKFLGSKADDDPFKFIEEAYQVIAVMGIPSKEKDELVAYQLKGVAKIWYEQWIEERGQRVGPIDWEEFKGAFLNSSFH